MVFATLTADLGFFLMVIVPLAMIGCRKWWGTFDKEGKIHGTAQKVAVGWLERLLKK